MNANIVPTTIMITSRRFNPVWMQYLKRIGLDLLKGAAAALASFIGLIVGNVVTTMLKLPTPGMPLLVEQNVVLLLMLLCGVPVAIVLGECFQHLYRRYWLRILSIWLCTYLSYYLLNTLDALLFSPQPSLSTSIISNLFPGLFAAVAIALLWRYKTPDPAPSSNINAYLTPRRPAALAWRLVLAWLVYPPIYFAMGMIVAPFVTRYYQDPSLNLGLTLPSMETLLAMQVLRGALFLLAAMPIIIAWRGSRLSLWLWVGTVIFIQIAIQTILMAYWLPAGLRIPHGLELLADSFLQAGAYALLLFFPAKPMSELVGQPSRLSKEGWTSNDL